MNRKKIWLIPAGYKQKVVLEIVQFCLEWASQGENRGRVGKRNKDYMKCLCCLQLLRNPCPALCLLQGAGVELDSGEGGETENRGEEKRSSTHRPTVPWDSDRLEPQTLRWATRTVDTPKTLMRTLCFPPIALPHLFKGMGKRIHNGTVQYSSWVHEGYVCLEHLYPSLAPSLSDYIMPHTTSTQFISLWLPILHLHTSHTAQPSLMNLM